MQLQSRVIMLLQLLTIAGFLIICRAPLASAQLLPPNPSQCFQNITTNIQPCVQLLSNKMSNPVDVLPKCCPIVTRVNNSCLTLLYPGNPQIPILIKTFCVIVGMVPPPPKGAAMPPAAQPATPKAAPTAQPAPPPSMRTTPAAQPAMPKAAPTAQPAPPPA